MAREFMDNVHGVQGKSLGCPGTKSMDLSIKMGSKSANWVSCQ